MTDFPAFITLPRTFERPAPPFEGNDIRFPEGLARAVIGRLSQKGDKVFDPFAGLGTTLFVAEDMGRIPYGIEADPDRFEWVAGQLEHWQHMICGDSAAMARFGLPKMDLALFSPPFMTVTQRHNPLTGRSEDEAYKKYLRRLKLIFGKLPDVMRRGAPVVLQVDNLPGRRFTPLIRDMGAALAGVMRQDGESVVAWKDAPADDACTHLLIFRNLKP